MALKAFKKTEFNDKDLTKFQTNIQEFLNQLNPILLDGRILSNIPIGTTTTEVPHGLTRSFQGYFVIDQQASAVIWRDTTSVADQSKFLPLKASAAVTVSLWVF